VDLACCIQETFTFVQCALHKKEGSNDKILNRHVVSSRSEGSRETMGRSLLALSNQYRFSTLAAKTQQQQHMYDVCTLPTGCDACNRQPTRAAFPTSTCPVSPVGLLLPLQHSARGPWGRRRRRPRGRLRRGPLSEAPRLRRPRATTQSDEHAKQRLARRRDRIDPFGGDEFGAVFPPTGG